MVYEKRRFLFGLLILCSLLPAPLWAQDMAETNQPATDATQQADDPMASYRAEAALAYEELVQAYLKNDWDKLDELTRSIRRHTRFFDRDQRNDVAYIQKSINDFRPRWWDKCASTSNISFQAEIWNKPLLANYMPTRAIGFQAVQAEGSYRKNRQGEYEPYITKLNVIVSWKPGLVNSQTPGTGKLAEIHEMKNGDLGEVIVWHELGHCYITNYLPLQHVIELYSEHGMLFSHLQEFYADLTSIQHSSPRARRFALMLRLDGLDHYDESEEHARASHGIGALILHQVLQDPDAWPSFHFPPAVPKQQVELNTIIYLYEHMDPDWSLKEARALRELAGDFISKSGEKTLRARGVAPLAGDMSFSLMAAQDHQYQAQRDAYVAKCLQTLIDSGRADKPEEGKTYDPPVRHPLGNGEKVQRDPEALRIDIPI
jgi:hypothetical protein